MLKGIKVTKKYISRAVLMTPSLSYLNRCPPPFLELADPLLHDSIRQVFTHVGLSKLTAVQMQCWSATLAGA